MKSKQIERSEAEIGLNRLESLTDGIFAIAMTILVLNIDVPKIPDPPSSLSLLRALTANWHIFLTYAISFYVLGTLWIYHTHQLHQMKYTTRRHLWLNILALMLVCLVPFSASMCGDYPDLRLSWFFFHLNLLTVGLIFFAQWRMASSQQHLLKDDPVESGTTRDMGHNLVLPAFALIAMGLSLWAPEYSSTVYLGSYFVLARFRWKGRQRGGDGRIAEPGR
ncbi:MAG: DUF1211 domain-containing protein [Deltaproteobacteria bacterium]|nr:DUF1211 domain-containing protein [Deltaproteobacteria bacterium]